MITEKAIDLVSIGFIGVQAYLAGLTFALAASPCSTPVLATLLGYVASTRVHILWSPSFFLVFLDFRAGLSCSSFEGCIFNFYEVGHRQCNCWSFFSYNSAPESLRNGNNESK